MKRLKNIEGKNEQQLEAIKDEQQLQTIKYKRLKLVDQKKRKKKKKDDEIKLKSLKHLTNKENKNQLQYFDMLANFE